MGDEDEIFMAPDDVRSVARTVGEIGDAMPSVLKKAKGEVAGLPSSNAWSTSAQQLAGLIGAFGQGYRDLTEQVTGFGTDLSECVTSWERTETMTAEAFAQYGKKLDGN